MSTKSSKMLFKRIHTSTSLYLWEIYSMRRWLVLNFHIERIFSGFNHLFLWWWWCSRHRGHVTPLYFSFFFVSVLLCRSLSEISASKQRTRANKVRINHCKRTMYANKEFYFRLNRKYGKLFSSPFLSFTWTITTTIIKNWTRFLFSDDAEFYISVALCTPLEFVRIKRMWTN